MTNNSLYKYGFAILTTAIFIFVAQTTTFAQQPANDNFASAQTLVLNGNAAGADGNLSFATSEPGEPQHAGMPGGSSVWYKFTPSDTIAARIKISNSAFMPMLAVYTGASVNALTSIGFSSRNVSGGNNSQADLMLVAGQIYFIAVDSPETSPGNNNFQITLVAAPVAPNDNFGAAHDFGSLSAGSIAGTNFGASVEPGEPLSGYSPASKTIWYRWTASADRSMFFEVSGNFNSNINIYSANVANPSFAQLNPQASNSSGFGTNGKHTAKFFAVAGKTYFISVDGRSGGTNNPIGNFQLRYGFNRFDYAANFSNQINRMSLVVYRPGENVWYTNLNFNGSREARFFGASGDVLMPADYNGDGETNYAVVRNENGRKIWYVLNASGTFYGVEWGVGNDRAAVGDFDRDGQADLTAIRQTANGLVWYVRRSSDNALRTFYFGANFDKPVFGDFDGDGATDIAVTRTGANGLTWYILKSGVDLSYTQLTSLQFGVSTDLRVAADYDADGKTDIAVFRPENGFWYILRLSDNQFQAIQFGAPGDIPQPGDFNGDGRADPVVFRPSNNTWYAARSNGVPAQNFDSIQWGADGDIPASSTANPQ